MKKYNYLRKFLLLICICTGLLMTACEDDDDVLDNTLRILSQKINDEQVVEGMADVSNDVSIEIIFSHTLDMAAFESALSFSGGGNPVAYSVEYSNTNSTVTITNDTDLGFETTYTLSLEPGVYGQSGESLMSAFSLSFTTEPFVPANVTLSSDLNTISEAGEAATLNLVLSEVLDETVTVNLAFGGTATQEVDYTVTNSTVTIPAGEDTVSLALTAVQDDLIEGTEMIEVSIASITNAEEIEPQLVSISIQDDDIDSNGDGTPDQGFIINEVLYDPPGGEAGDANGDGTRSASEDEFIEFVNDSDQPVDLSGFTLFDADMLETGTPRHVFPEGTIIPPLGVYVLFGGGSPSGDFGTATVAASSTGNMNLNNADDKITIFDTEGNVFLTFDTQVEGAGLSFGENQSITRNPDINGAYDLHTNANVDLVFSPGKKADGSNFAGGGAPPVRRGFLINEVLYDPPSDLPGDANGDGTRSASEDEFIEFVNDSDEAVDLSGFRLFDNNRLGTEDPRHVFPAGTVIPPDGVYVLFGGGAPSGDFGGAQVAVSSSGNMNLNNSGDAITILDTEGNVFLFFDSTVDGAGIDFGSDQSVTRSPDIEGDFTLHGTANPALLFSPGTRTNGSGF